MEFTDTLPEGWLQGDPFCLMFGRKDLTTLKQIFVEVSSHIEIRDLVGILSISTHQAVKMEILLLATTFQNSLNLKQLILTLPYMTILCTVLPC